MEGYVGHRNPNVKNWVNYFLIWVELEVKHRPDQLIQITTYHMLFLK